MSGVDEIRLGWAVLKEAARATPTALSTQKLPVEVSAGWVLLAMGMGGEQHLLIPLAADGPEDTQSDSVQIVNRRLGPPGDERPYADVVLLTAGVGEVFDHLLADMLEQLQRSPKRPVEACIAVLDRWRALLRAVGRPGLGKQQLGGLYAELDVLRALVERDPTRRLDLWVGPKGARHDFRRGRIAMESKASLASTGRDAVIHGFDQLLPPDEGMLFIVWSRLEEVPGGGESVPDLVANLLELGAPAQELLAAVALAGSPAELNEAHAAVTFEVRERLIYEVDADFPRLTGQILTGGALPLGVHSVAYHVDLDHARALPDDSAEAVMLALAVDTNS